VSTHDRQRLARSAPHRTRHACEAELSTSRLNTAVPSSPAFVDAFADGRSRSRTPGTNTNRRLGEIGFPRSIATPTGRQAAERAEKDVGARVDPRERRRLRRFDDVVILSTCSAIGSRSVAPGT